jgi:hemolysin D
VKSVKSIALPTSSRAVSRHEREFLPAALEIIETPPSPIGRLGGYVIASVFVVAIVWACFGQIDIVAVAKGKIIPTGYTKIIQPFETGVVRAIHVNDGDKVTAGDLLIELDPTMNEADLGHLEGDLMAAKIDIARLKAALVAETDTHADFEAPDGATPAQADMGRRFYLGQILQYRSKVASLVGEEAQKRAEQASLTASIGKIDALLPMMQERMQMRKTLFDHQTGSKISYLESLQEIVSNQKDREVQKSRLLEADAALAEAEAKREEMMADYRRTNLSELAEAQRKVSGLSQDVARADAVRPNRSAHREFPANREKNREIVVFGPFSR